MAGFDLGSRQSRTPPTVRPDNTPTGYAYRVTWGALSIHMDQDEASNLYRAIGDAVRRQGFEP